MGQDENLFKDPTHSGVTVLCAFGKIQLLMPKNEHERRKGVPSGDNREIMQTLPVLCARYHSSWSSPRALYLLFLLLRWWRVVVVERDSGVAAERLLQR